MDSIQALGWSLLHFVWQGALIGAGLFLALLALRRASAQARYVVSCTALLLLALAPLVTFGALSRWGHPGSYSDSAVIGSPVSQQQERWNEKQNVPGSDSTALGTADAQRVGSRPWWSFSRGRATLESSLSWIVTFWVVGAALCLLRLGAGWMRINRLRRRATHPASDPLQRTFVRLVRHLGIQRTVRLALSSGVAVPTVIGWLRPVVIVPACAVTGLSYEQLEAVLAHELAHIRRHDYVVNLLQSVVESLLFTTRPCGGSRSRFAASARTVATMLPSTLAGTP